MSLLRGALSIGVIAAIAFLGEDDKAVARVSAATSPSLAAGTLAFSETMTVTSPEVPCPPTAPPGSYQCRDRVMTADFRGLGRVSLSYLWSYGLGPPTCPSTTLARPN